MAYPEVPGKACGLAWCPRRDVAIQNTEEHEAAAEKRWVDGQVQRLAASGNACSRSEAEECQVAR